MLHKHSQSSRFLNFTLVFLMLKPSYIKRSPFHIITVTVLWCFHTRARQRQDDKTNVEPVHSYNAFHTRFVGPGVKGIIGKHRFNICLVVVLLWCENTIVILESVNTFQNLSVCHLGMCIAPWRIIMHSIVSSKLPWSNTSKRTDHTNEM